ncbi:hypothetical protein CAPTEDRAFT_223978 [Capitella teleta]|uniref:Uncharacterized protein n=1 Tax=Capitella teleta TaxID=283909 RepID=R7TBJ8_CAPTE|nr:hypothetical protein CAPTEDRAFT_223978 [Capitella teleta]|eukprot:ELT91113.1 hypothetical protein CAPTEDRAFT_223978 [Capitella teleta]
MTWRLGRWTYVVITIFLSTETVAVGWNVHNYPDSPENVELCGRNVSSEHVSHVCDPDGVITPLEASEIDELAQKTCAQTTCDCADCGSNCAGVHISVAVVSEFGIKKGESAKREAQYWARELRTNRWKYGACADDDVVIVLSKDNKRAYTSTGSKVREILTDACVSTIFYEARRYFEVCQFGQGLGYMTLRYTESLIGGQCSSSRGGVIDALCNKPAPSQPKTTTLRHLEKENSEEQNVESLGSIFLIVLGVGSSLVGVCACCYAKLTGKCCFKGGRSIKSRYAPTTSYHPTSGGGYGGGSEVKVGGGGGGGGTRSSRPAPIIMMTTVTIVVEAVEETGEAGIAEEVVLAGEGVVEEAGVLLVEVIAEEEEEEEEGRLFVKYLSINSIGLDVFDLISLLFNSEANNAFKQNIRSDWGHERSATESFDLPQDQSIIGSTALHMQLTSTATDNTGATQLDQLPFSTVHTSSELRLSLREKLPESRPIRTVSNVDATEVSPFDIAELQETFEKSCQSLIEGKCGDRLDSFVDAKQLWEERRAHVVRVLEKRRLKEAKEREKREKETEGCAECRVIYERWGSEQKYLIWLRNQSRKRFWFAETEEYAIIAGADNRVAMGTGEMCGPLFKNEVESLCMYN